MLEGQEIKNVQGFYQMVGDRGNGTTEFYRYDGTNIRLRELSLGYSFPQQMLEKTGFTSHWWPAICSSSTKMPRSTRTQQCP